MSNHLVLTEFMYTEFYAVIEFLKLTGKPLKVEIYKKKRVEVALTTELDYVPTNTRL